MQTAARQILIKYSYLQFAGIKKEHFWSGIGLLTLTSYQYDKTLITDINVYTQLLFYQSGDTVVV